MKNIITALALAAICTQSLNAQSLQHAYRDFLRVGVSVNQWEVKAENAVKEGVKYTGAYSTDQTANYPLIAQHFGWVVPENVSHEVLPRHLYRCHFDKVVQFLYKSRQIVFFGLMLAMFRVLCS